MEKKVTTPVTKGLIISLILIVIGLVVYFTDQMGNKALSWAQYLIFLAGIIWACLSYTKDMHGNVTFGNVFSHGFKTTAFVIAMLAVYSLLAVKFIFPDMVDKGIEQARAEMEKNPNMTEETMEKALAWSKEYFVPFLIGGLILIFGILGCIGSVIGAAVSKKNPQAPFNQ